MRLNSFSVRVVGGTEDGSGYVALQHGQKYSLVLRNDRLVQADVKVEIDGQDCGTFRIPAKSSITIERPSQDNGHLTFFKTGTHEGDKAGIKKGDPSVGLVKCTFTPEKPAPVYTWTNWNGYPWSVQPYRWHEPIVVGSRHCYTNSTCSLDSANSISCAAEYEAGGTGLSGESQQAFVPATHIDYDLSLQTVIHLRLVCKSSEDIRPLTCFSTPVPPAVD